MPHPDGAEVAAAKRLLDLAKRQGFAFQRVAPGEDGPLFARRETIEYHDELYLGGVSDFPPPPLRFWPRRGGIPAPPANPHRSSAHSGDHPGAEARRRRPRLKASAQSI